MKRVRSSEEEEDDGQVFVPHNPYQIRQKAVLTWLWIRKNNPHIIYCVNNDIAKKIASLIKVVLDYMYVDHGAVGKLTGKTGFPSYYWWSKRGRTEPCPICLRPLFRRLTFCDRGITGITTCEKHGGLDELKYKEWQHYSTFVEIPNATRKICFQDEDASELEKYSRRRRI